MSSKNLIYRSKAYSQALCKETKLCHFFYKPRFCKIHEINDIKNQRMTCDSDRRLSVPTKEMSLVCKSFFSLIFYSSVGCAQYNSTWKDCQPKSLQKFSFFSSGGQGLWTRWGVQVSFQFAVVPGWHPMSASVKSVLESYVSIQCVIHESDEENIMYLCRLLWVSYIREDIYSTWMINNRVYVQMTLIERGYLYWKFFDEVQLITKSFAKNAYNFLSSSSWKQCFLAYVIVIFYSVNSVLECKEFEAIFSIPNNQTVNLNYSAKRQPSFCAVQ